MKNKKQLKQYIHQQVHNFCKTVKMDSIECTYTLIKDPVYLTYYLDDTAYNENNYLAIVYMLRVITKILRKYGYEEITSEYTLQDMARDRLHITLSEIELLHNSYGKYFVDNAETIYVFMDLMDTEQYIEPEVLEVVNNLIDLIG